MNSSRAVRSTLVVGTAVPALAAAGAEAMHGWSRLGSALASPVPGPAIVALAQVVAAGCVCWLMAGALLTVLGEMPWTGRALARRLAHACTPGCWRTAVLAVVGIGVLGSPALATAALPSAPPDVTSDRPVVRHPAAARHDATGLDTLDGLVLPDRPSGAWQRGPGRQAVIVRPGDTLWAISARSLPGGADVAAVARACTRWYDANAAEIGPDPDLLLPGTRLRAPVSRHAPFQEPS